jgi:hypothetical protein
MKQICSDWMVQGKCKYISQKVIIKLKDKTIFIKFMILSFWRIKEKIKKIVSQSLLINIQDGILNFQLMF